MKASSQPPGAIPGRIGPYRITGELGRGGIGTVYRAVDPAGRAIALKCLLRGGDPDTDARLLRESSIRVEHPNVVRTLGGGLSGDGQPYLVLELLEGRTLRDALVDAPTREVVSWLAQAAEGVSALHAAGLVHRDIKPENLFLTRDGTVKVLDLGIAAWTDDRARMTATGAVVGTPAYLAPEQVRGARALDPRIDVWALGVVLFEGLTGRSPFRREGALASMLAVSVDPIPRVDDLAPHVPPRLARLVHACMERTPTHRLATAALLATGLRELLDEGVLEGTTRAPITRPEVERAIALLLAPSAPDTRHAVEGIVSEAGGDCLWLADGRVVGIFGAAESMGDEAERVVRTAGAVAKLTGTVSIALGRASVGRGHARGEAVREAEETLARAPAGTVCGARTAQLLRGRHALDEIAPGAYRLGDDTRRAATPSPLLARDVELGLLRRARDAAIAESTPQVTWILGAPGTGKTRLAESVRGLAAETIPPMTVREAHASRAGAPATPLFALAARGALTSQRPDEDATIRVDRARDALISELALAASEGPLALVLEDAQWADAQALALLEDLPRHLAGLPVWLVVTGRPELLERLREPPERGAIVEPAPLTARDAIALARALGVATPSAEAAQALVAHTGGNPLFVEVVLGAFGASLDAETLTQSALPATIEFAVQARLDRLPRAARDVMIALSLLERAADAGELAELGCADAEGALELLAARDLVVRGPSAGHTGRAYRVRSPVVAQVAAALPSQSERVELHRRAAALAATRRRDEEELGHHLEAAGEQTAAASAYLAAALAAMNGGDARKVLRCGRAALRCGLAVEDAFELHLARADAARWAGDVDEQAHALADAERAADTDRERARVRSAQGDLARRRGDPEGAIVSLDASIVLARVAEDPDTLAWASCRRAIACVSLGRCDEAEASLAALEGVEGLALATRGAIEDARGYVAGTRGDLAERRRAFAAAAELHAAAGDPRRAAGAESNAADAAHLLGLDAQAEAGLRRAIALARRVGNRLTEGYASANLGRTLGSLGRLAEAREALAQAQALARQVGDPHLRAAAALYACRLAPDAPSTREELAPLLEDDSAVIRAGAHLLAVRHASSPEAARVHVEAAVRLAESGLEESEIETWRQAADAMATLGDPARAATLRARADARLEELASLITDPEMRARFLERGR